MTFKPAITGNINDDISGYVRRRISDDGVDAVVKNAKHISVVARAPGNANQYEASEWYLPYEGLLDLITVATKLEVAMREEINKKELE